MADLLTAVVPLRVAARRSSDLDRFARLLLPSFERFWIRPEQLQFLLPVPPGDLPAVIDRLGPCGRFAIDVISEDELCPALAGRSGWHKQQILKLAAARVVRTPHYLTLDADIILRRPCSLHNLFVRGKPVLNQSLVRYHPAWWEASASLLGYQPNLALDARVMGVTPQVLHRRVALELLTAVAERNRVSDAASFLFDTRDLGWTEYSLYWLHMLERGLVQSLYDLAPQAIAQGFWKRHELGSLTGADVDQLLDPTTGAYFVVFQSNLELKIRHLERLLAPLLGREMGPLNQLGHATWRAVYLAWHRWSHRWRAQLALRAPHMAE